MRARFLLTGDESPPRGGFGMSRAHSHRPALRRHATRNRRRHERREQEALTGLVSGVLGCRSSCAMGATLPCGRGAAMARMAVACETISPRLRRCADAFCGAAAEEFAVVASPIHETFRDGQRDSNGTLQRRFHGVYLKKPAITTQPPRAAMGSGQCKRTRGLSATSCTRSLPCLHNLEGGENEHPNIR